MSGFQMVSIRAEPDDDIVVHTMSWPLNNDSEHYAGYRPGSKYPPRGSPEAELRRQQRQDYEQARAARASTRAEQVRAEQATRDQRWLELQVVRQQKDWASWEAANNRNRLAFFEKLAKKEDARTRIAEVLASYDFRDRD